MTTIKKVKKSVRRAGLMLPSLVILSLILLISTFGPLQAAQVYPAQNALDVPANTVITAMADPESVSLSDVPDPVGTDIPDSMLVFGSIQGLISGTTTFDSLANSITFTPDSQFVAGEVVTATWFGAGTFSWKFTIAAEGHGPLALTEDYSMYYPYHLVAADFDLNRSADLAVGSGASGVALALNNADASFGSFTYYATESVSYALESADIDLTDGQDLISVLLNSGQVYYLKNQGDGTFSSSMVYDAPNQIYDVDVCDFNNDGYTDIAFVGNWSSQVFVMYYSPEVDSFISSFAPINIGYSANAVEAADVNNDGLMDLIVGRNSLSGGIVVLLNSGSSFSLYSSFGGQHDDIKAGDLNSDGYVDLVVTSSSLPEIFIFLNNGYGSFNYSESDSVGSVLSGNSHEADLLDFDGDGDLDIASFNTLTNEVVILYNAGNATFAQQEFFILPSTSGYGSNDVAPADYDNDGDIDLAITNYLDNTVNILLQYLPGDFDGSNYVNMLDILALIDYKFKGGPPPRVLNSVDVNGDCNIDMLDVLYLIDFKYKEGPAPVPGCVTAGGGVPLSKQAVRYGDDAATLIFSKDNGKTVCTLSSPVEISALEIEYRASKESVLTTSLDDIEIFSGQDNGISKALILDVEGQHKLVSANFESIVFELSDDAEITYAEAAAADGYTVPVRIESSLKSGSVPDRFTLDQNRPNPFNPTTSISYSLPQAGDVHLDIFNITGQKVTTLVNQYQDAGGYNVSWNSCDDKGNPVASGVYFYRLKTEDITETKKMILMK